MPDLRHYCWAAMSACVLLACAAPQLSATAPRCQGLCASHEDGYQWAQRGTLTDASQCAGYSEAFMRGCRDAVNDFSQLKPASTGL